MYFGEKASSILFSSLGLLTVYFFIDGLLHLWGFSALTGIASAPRLTDKPDSTAFINSIVGGFSLVLILSMAISYARESKVFKREERIIPRLPGLEDGEENYRLQVCAFRLFIGLPFIVNIFYLIRYYTALIVQKSSGVGLADNFWDSRIIALKSECNFLISDCFRVGKGGIQYFPILSDLLPLIVWVLVVILFFRWAKLQV